MILLALVLAMQQHPDTNVVLPPSVRGMLSRFPPPRSGLPSITVRFSRDSVWLGEQVEMVTAIWFPRQLRDRLRRPPSITPPSLTGLWSARNQRQPVPADTRRIGDQVFDLYVSYQTIFPLGAGRIVAPPAVLSYGVPVSTSYFAPEERRTLNSQPAALVVRAIPASLAASVGTGPTAHNLRLVWRGPAGALHVGAPSIVELVIAGEGNLTLWPTPQVAWPSGVHVYPEPTEEHAGSVQGVIAGEKHFRFTVVPDTAGVLTLPVVSYVYFDATAVVVRTAVSNPFEIPVLARLGEEAGRATLSVTDVANIPLATRIRRSWWPALLLLVLLGPGLALVRAHRRGGVVRRPALNPSNPEQALRAALGAPVDAGPDHVVAALRRRGVPRDDAEHIHRWLSTSARRRYGPQRADETEPPSMVARVLARLRHLRIPMILLLIALPLHGRQDDGVSRYRSGDYAAAARAFSVIAARTPDDVSAWTNLGAARWMQGDDVGAAAAWLSGLRLAPRSDTLQEEWARIPAVPSDIRALVPSWPASRDELLLLAIGLWCVGWIAVTFRARRVAWVAASLCAAALVVVATRIRGERSGLALVASNTVMHVSPHPATMALAELGIWSPVRVLRSEHGWLLVETQIAASGLPVGATTEGWVPASAVATIGPLD